MTTATKMAEADIEVHTERETQALLPGPGTRTVLVDYIEMRMPNGTRETLMVSMSAGQTRMLVDSLRRALREWGVMA